MNILIFATLAEFSLISEVFKNTYDNINCIHATDNEVMLCELAKGNADIAIISVDGALGMEIAISVRSIDTDIPLIWFSNDIHFGPQAYRLDCNYFSGKPMTKSRLITAMHRISSTARI